MTKIDPKREEKRRASEAAFLIGDVVATLVYPAVYVVVVLHHKLAPRNPWRRGQR